MDNKNNIICIIISILAKHPPSVGFFSHAGGTAPSAAVKEKNLGRLRRPIVLKSSAGS